MKLPIEDPPPSQQEVTLTGEYIDRLAERVGESAAEKMERRFEEKMIGRDELKTIMSSAIDEKMFDLFGVPPGDRKAEVKFREDFSKVLEGLELRKMALRHGYWVLIAILIGGAVSTFWFGLVGKLAAGGK